MLVFIAGTGMLIYIGGLFCDRPQEPPDTFCKAIRCAVVQTCVPLSAKTMIKFVSVVEQLLSGQEECGEVRTAVQFPSDERVSRSSELHPRLKGLLTKTLVRGMKWRKSCV